MSVGSADAPASKDNVDLARRRNIRAAGIHAIIELYHCPRHIYLRKAKSGGGRN